MSLATYASPFETGGSESDATTIYSRARRGSAGGAADAGTSNRTRKRNAKNRPITNIIRMLHEDMSGDEDDAPFETPRGAADERGREGFRGGLKKEREGILNMEDKDDMASAGYITDTVNHARDSFNLSQKIGMDAENKRLAETKMSHVARMRSAFPRGDFVAPPRPDGAVNGASQFGTNEYEYVSQMGGNLSSSEVGGDGTDVYYANAAHTPGSSAPSWDKDKEDTVTNRPQSSRYQRPIASMADEKRQQMSQSQSQSPMRGSMKRPGPYPEYYEGEGVDGAHGGTEYDSASSETYKCPNFNGELVECRYDQKENDGFRYPKWSTRKNRHLHHDVNAHLKARGASRLEDDHDEERTSRGANAAQSFELERLMKKMDYLVHMMEDNEETKNNYVVEELILYCFLGFFVLFVVDSFTNVNVKYKR